MGRGYRVFGSVIIANGVEVGGWWTGMVAEDSRIGMLMATEIAHTIEKAGDVAEREVEVGVYYPFRW